MTAQKRPLTEADVIKQIKKTGGSAFSVDDIHIEMGDNVFLPVSSLNELRRDALDKLWEKLSEKGRRSFSEHPADVSSLEAVSYTHLDVYKRQELIGFYRSISRYEEAFAVAEDVLLLMEELQLEGTVPVSYTHLDTAFARRNRNEKAGGIQSSGIRHWRRRRLYG